MSAVEIALIWWSVSTIAAAVLFCLIARNFPG
jgi:hypothetical protein